MKPRGQGLGRGVLAAVLLGLGSCSASEPPNLLLVVVDTLRADHSSAYGYGRDTTPRLAALALEGVRFEAAYAPMGLTGPSHASLFTSLHPLSHGVSKNGLALDPEADTLAERLSAAGYQTAAVVSSFVLDDRFGLDQGFAFYDDELEPAEGTVEVEHWEGHGVERGFDRRADHTARRAIGWLREQRDADRPFFLFVHFFDPHSPWEPPESPFEAGLEAASELERLVARYDAEIAFTDARLGELLDALADTGEAANTLVAVTADHGEGLMQRGYLLHGISVHEEEVRVPLVMRWPARIAPGRSIGAPVALVDLVASVLELFELESPGSGFEGVSFAPALLGRGSADPERPVYLQRRRFAEGQVRPDLEALPGGAAIPPVSVEGEQFALRRGRWKYVHAPAENRSALYDLRDDPGERNDLRDSDSERSERMRAELEAWIGAHRRSHGASRLSDETERRLRALGYTD